MDPLPVRIRDALNGAQFDELAAVHVWMAPAWQEKM
jgi:hypothetical protein